MTNYKVTNLAREQKHSAFNKSPQFCKALFNTDISYKRLVPLWKRYGAALLLEGNPNGYKILARFIKCVPVLLPQPPMHTNHFREGGAGRS